jgi:hypothetical protein
VPPVPANSLVVGRARDGALLPIHRVPRVRHGDGAPRRIVEARRLGAGDVTLVESPPGGVGIGRRIAGEEDLHAVGRGRRAIHVHDARPPWARRRSNRSSIRCRCHPTNRPTRTCCPTPTCSQTSNPSRCPKTCSPRSRPTRSYRTPSSTRTAPRRHPKNRTLRRFQPGQSRRTPRALEHSFLPFAATECLNEERRMGRSNRSPAPLPFFRASCRSLFARRPTTAAGR